MNELEAVGTGELIVLLERAAGMLRAAQAENEALKVRTKQLDLVEDSGSAMDMQTAAGLIREHFRINETFGREKLYEMLRAWGVIMKGKNQVYSEYVGRFKNVAPARGGQFRPSVKVTMRGIAWIVEEIPKRERWQEPAALITT